MTSARKILLAGGLALAIWGMSYGLYYAVFVEHQTLDHIGGSLDMGFEHAAGRNLPQAHASLNEYANAAYVYVRQVDVHSHWIGLAMILFILAFAFDGVGFSDCRRRDLAVLLVLGAILFPLGVFTQTLVHGVLGSVLAVAGAAFLILGLAATAVGFARGTPAQS
jgi:hypothetical protein